MAKSYQRTLLLGLIMLAPLYAGCERAADIAGVTEAPAQTLTLKSRHNKVLKRTSVGTSGTVVSDWTNHGKPLTLEIGKYKLWVPKGAVKNPTIFRMTVLTGSVVGVSLEAFDNQGDPVTQFQTPLRLTLPYDEADEAEIDNPSHLLLANIVSESDPTILEIVNPAVNQKHKTITGSITHFSVWSLAIQLSKELSPGID
jgi:hypothetical protein